MGGADSDSWIKNLSIAAKKVDSDRFTSWIDPLQGRKCQYYISHDLD